MLPLLKFSLHGEISRLATQPHPLRLHGSELGQVQARTSLFSKQLQPLGKPVLHYSTSGGESLNNDTDC